MVKKELVSDLENLNEQQKQKKTPENKPKGLHPFSQADIPALLVP